MSEGPAVSDLRAYTILQAAELASVSYETMRLAVRGHRIAARYVGRKALIRPADLEAWLDSLPEEP